MESCLVRGLAHSPEVLEGVADVHHSGAPHLPLLVRLAHVVVEVGPRSARSLAQCIRFISETNLRSVPPPCNAGTTQAAERT